MEEQLSSGELKKGEFECEGKIQPDVEGGMVYGPRYSLSPGNRHVWRGHEISG